jgi:hypothetical protein
MKIKVQLALCAEDGCEEQVQEIAVVEKLHQRIERLGLTLAAAKAVLKRLQQHLIEQQATAFVAAHAQRDHCGTSLGIKEYHTRTFCTLFGTATLTSPRLYYCRCQRRKTTTFRPLNALLTDSVTPELLFMETKWASLVSYGLTAQALKDFLPVDATLNATTIQNHTLAVAQCCEDGVFCPTTHHPPDRIGGEVRRRQSVFVEPEREANRIVQSIWHALPIFLPLDYRSWTGLRYAAHRYKGDGGPSLSLGTCDSFSQTRCGGSTPRVLSGGRADAGTDPHLHDQQGRAG